MASSSKTGRKAFDSVFTVCAIWAIVFFSIAPDQTLAKSRRPISDIEIREKKNQCYADIESGLWGRQCKSSMIAKENCALQCLSPACYDLIYEGDPLEEGEKDIFRGQEYKYCMHKLSLGESLDGIKGSFS
ncbi:Protein OS-9 like [Actinidia chinensis var. chinensis]|uniref:Protein OS-9 like n=1 Tax=Actinidia chinensis var. chinensis TaxID=1590841 RepID=A0A2R6RCY5_ACTCC|nr:Protein OS-9 like [Actinidia chinensis var. chinensis]